MRARARRTSHEEQFPTVAVSARLRRFPRSSAVLLLLDVPRGRPRPGAAGPLAPRIIFHKLKEMTMGNEMQGRRSLELMLTATLIAGCATAPPAAGNARAT